VNLIGNAVKYTAVGSISVRARLVSPAAVARATGIDGRDVPTDDPMPTTRPPDVRRSWIALQVIDTGVGIAPEDRARIFQEFEQVNAGPRGESMQRGTGLGLAISRRLAQLLGGDVGLESQVGKGSNFILWLPVHPADIERRTPPGPAVPAPPAD